jgi:hypothetical protein
MPDGDAVIRERPRRVEGMREGSSLSTNPRVPEPVRVVRSTRGTAVVSVGPTPLHCIARVDRDL